MACKLPYRKLWRLIILVAFVGAAHLSNCNVKPISQRSGRLKARAIRTNHFLPDLLQMLFDPDGNNS